AAEMHAAAGQSIGLFDLGGIDGPARRNLTPGVFLDRLITGPYVHVSLVNTSAQLLEMRRQIQTLHDCRSDARVLQDHVNEGLPRWNRIARTALPSLVHSWDSVRALSLSRELTLAVIEGRAGGPRPIPSAACEGFTWQQSVEGRALKTA